MLDALLEGGTYDSPAYIAFLIMAYNETYGWNRPLTDFFTEEYAMVLEQRLTGAYGDGAINPFLTNNLHELLSPEFLSGLEDPEGETEFKDALEMNAVSTWKATVPIRLYHGTEDAVVPYSNSEATLESMIAAGSAEVSLISIPGGTHGNSLLPMLALAVPWFEVLRMNQHKNAGGAYAAFDFRPSLMGLPRRTRRSGLPDWRVMSVFRFDTLTLMILPRK